MKRIAQIIYYILGLIAAITTIIDSSRIRAVWQAFQTEEPLLVALVLLQTSWFLFGVLFLGSIVKFHHERKLTREKVIWSGIAALIAGFLLTWGVRALYFGVTGQSYPGQDILEFRVQTIIAGILFFLFGIVIVIFAFIGEMETGAEISDLIYEREQITKKSEEITRLQESLRSMLSEKHTQSCETLEKKCREVGMFHYNMAKNEADCTCSCHK